MSFTVRGYINGVAYSLAVGDDNQLDGTRGVIDLLQEHQGRQVKVTPTGPVLTVDVEAPDSVLGALMALTEIVSVEGDPPELFEPGPAGAVY